MDLNNSTPKYKFNLSMDKWTKKDRTKELDKKNKKLYIKPIKLIEKKLVKSKSTSHLNRHFVSFYHDNILIEYIGFFKSKKLLEKYSNITEILIIENNFNNLNEYKSIRIYFYKDKLRDFFGNLSPDYLTITFSYNDYMNQDIDDLIKYISKRNKKIKIKYNNVKAKKY